MTNLEKIKEIKRLVTSLRHTTPGLGKLAALIRDLEMEMEEEDQFTEPIPLKAGDTRVKINGTPVLEDFRIISEANYQIIKNIYNKWKLTQK